MLSGAFSLASFEDAVVIPTLQRRPKPGEVGLRLPFPHGRDELVGQRAACGFVSLPALEPDCPASPATRETIAKR